MGRPYALSRDGTFLLPPDDMYVFQEQVIPKTSLFYCHVVYTLKFIIKVSFAITINKAQGQTFQYVAIDLRVDCFSHGHLYM